MLQKECMKGLADIVTFNPIQKYSFLNWNQTRSTKKHNMSNKSYLLGLNA